MEISKKIKAGRFVLAGTLAAITTTLTGCGKIERNQKEYVKDTKEYYSLYSDITDEDIQAIPRETDSIYLAECHYVTDLSSLSKNCPNLSSIYIYNCSGITDLSFIYSMTNLEKIVLNETAGITPDLICYLNEKGIRYDIESDDIEAAQIAQQIVDEIITDDMTDEEKVKAITVYVSKNCGYSLFYTNESNENPLSTTLLKKKGVCAGIAYTTNVLLRLAGIESYEVSNNSHGWNIIKIDDEYSYIDVTNLGGGLLPKKLSGTLLDKFDLGLGGYLIDPRTTGLTAMSDYDSKKIVIPNKLVEDIENGLDEKTLIERYGNTVGIRVIELILIIIGIKAGIALLGRAKEEIEYRRCR